ncbi:MAG: ACP S-malonyltransferase [Gammaproteobacteria bacterium]|nr:ACP S-malonyltransferase [Gammaproteobacteria bacterium]MCW5583720.1 ACP S-malonyltransferase [Gammaproteobacteria bacterium]
MTTYVFPGQGSQFKGMGGALFSEFQDIVSKANQILGYPVEKLCLEGPDDKLNMTQYTQPAIYVVSALSYFKKLKDSGKKPDYVAGHSLGEYNALLAAGVFDFETGLKLVQERGSLMANASGGAMAAIIGPHSGEIQTLLDKSNLSSISIANFNSFTQTVIAGLKNEIDAAKPIFESINAMFIPLKVSGAFHSSYMKPAQQKFSDFLKGFEFKAPNAIVIANVNAEPYKIDVVMTNLANQITHPVQWTKTIKYLLDKGETIFEEVGPGSVLTGLIRRIQNGK